MAGSMHIPVGEKAPPALGGTRLLGIAAVVAALGSFLFGFDTAVISGTTKALQDAFSLDKFWLGFTVSSALFGTAIGALLAGRPADWWGRRKVLWLLAVLFVAASIGCALAWNWYALIAFRWLGGVGVGAARMTGRGATTGGLGLTGRREGRAAQAVALVRKTAG